MSACAGVSGQNLTRVSDRFTRAYAQQKQRCHEQKIHAGVVALTYIEAEANPTVSRPQKIGTRVILLQRLDRDEE